MSCPCFIVPPHLFRGIAESSSNPEHVRKAAHASLAAHGRIGASRQQRMAMLTQPLGSEAPPYRPSPFIPEGVLTRLSVSEAVDEVTRERAKRDLEHLQTFMAKPPPAEQAIVAAEAKDPHKDRPKDAPYRAVYDAKMTRDEDDLPGELVRAEGEAKVKDKDVNLAYENVGHVLDFYKKHFKWNSIDNKNADIISSVHFGRHFENAFWDPDKLQMVFGDGGEFLQNFTGCIDVIGHELTHAITEHTSPLQYRAQPGALNEHISDVFGIMIKQKVEDETADKADWLVGEGCLLPGIKGLALRSMKSPGTAYDDPRFGKDPQVDNMKMYEETYEDNGGVHIFSGIPNKAFYLAAVAFGGYSWEKAGQIWWKAMTSGRVPPKCNFLQFADVTVDCAKEEFGEMAAKTVRKAWHDVGVMRSV
ncbi:thermolysin metallopeptidase, alpha-helical domain-containing protein [Hirsutella rhossiliensis]|uniref:Thermolysin metallopeptidase, alpha-helical domain-containing protein n=1 Tax=Hirsutella rhossiliensis TaxID=111463 RepID=A0A9P8SF49_9HYPO|nr:thermolysin metallopeptidase, alpha-helical domain-containing protein [Hirsutella rhossiliensis]KAH0958656.1 thermolysin metallopeptidase, alpha-helical domain-containing protein [Hirsutella rhossiliensis]